MAFSKPSLEHKGLTVSNAYLRVSNVEYIHNGKRVAFLISSYANKAASDANMRLDDVFVGQMDIALGADVADILAQIYTDIKGKRGTDEKYAIFVDCTDV